MPKEILSFRLWGDYALYTKPWCNREQQSYLIPPKTSLFGLIGSILGCGKEEYLEKLDFDEIKTGINLKNFEGKELHGYNFMHGKNLDKKTKNLSNPYRNPSRKGALSPTRLEFIRNPEYRIYLYLKDKKIKRQLSDFLRKNKCVFPPYLGQVNLFANFGDFYKTELDEKNVNYSETAAPAEIIDGSEIEGKIYNERLPVKMEEDRSSPKFKSIAISKDNPLKIKDDSKYLIGETTQGSQIVLF
ncbi:hypothetical protein C9439_00075 [archaeon SCG-AAA382B04]|nr:hypothetical protein C9439_00075 [archaeon SCG-AAA382B04]